MHCDSYATVFPDSCKKCFFHTGRNECPFVNLFISESFFKNVTVWRETAVQQYQTYFMYCCGQKKNTCKLKSTLNVNKEKLVIMFVCAEAERKEMMFISKARIGKWCRLCVNA